MVYPYSYVNKVPVIEIVEEECSFADIDVEEFYNDIIQLNVHAAERIALDLSKKSFCSSADLGVLLKIKDLLIDDGIDIVLINPSDKAVELLKMVGVFDLFLLSENAEELL